MKLLRIGDPGHERPVAMDQDGLAYDLSGIAADIGPAELGDGLVDRARLALAERALPPVALDGVRVGAPIVRPGKIICVGLNYADHARETNAEIPQEPVLFMKDPGCVIGPYDQVLLPVDSVKTDWEVELAVVIGREARYLRHPDDAPRVIAGYALSHDVSEREYQLERGGQWDKGKSCETFQPLGPWLVTADELPNLRSLRLRTTVNGQLRQDGSTADMIFGVDEIVSYVSRFMVLRPGDVINTGTPAGVALGLPGQPYLRAGDVVELEADGLGHQRQTIGQARA